MILVEKLQAYADVECDVLLKNHTTFRVGGKCKYFIYPKDELCLLRIIEILKEEQIIYKLLGKGSNMLCSDDFFDGAIICLDRYFTDFYFTSDGECLVQAGCSIILLAHEAMKASLTGLEFASGIPGTVGGAIFMNAGAYKSDISQILKEVYVLKGQDIVAMKTSELAYSYRHSLFQQHPDWIIIGCCLQLAKGNQKEIRDIMDARRKRRMETQPLNKPCAGSVFRNPENHQAWKLIDDIGYRGKCLGGAMVSEKHSNFIVNENYASAEDIVKLIEEIQRKVKERYEIELITEVEKFNWNN